MYTLQGTLYRTFQVNYIQLVGPNIAFNHFSAVGKIIPNGDNFEKNFNGEKAAKQFVCTIIRGV